MVLKLADWAEANPKLVSGIILFVASLLGLRIALTAAQYAFLQFRGAALLAGLGITRLAGFGKAALFAPLLNSVGLVSRSFQLMRMRTSLATAQLGRSPGLLSRAADGFLVFGREIGRGIAPLTRMRSLVGGIGRLAAGGVIGMVAFAGIEWLINNAEGIWTAMRAFGKSFMDNLGPAKPIVEGIGSAIGAIFDWISKITGPLDESGESWRRWGTVVGEFAAGGVRTVISAIERFISVVDAAIGKMKALGGAIKNALGFGGGPASSDSGPSYDAMGNAIPARAGGGPIGAHQATLVGEEGPEIVTFGRSGMVHPNGVVPGAGATIKIGDIHINGAQDPIATAEAVYRMLNDRLADAMRSLHSAPDLTYT